MRVPIVPHPCQHVEHLFTCSLAICTHLLMRCLLRSFAHFFIGWSVFALLSIELFAYLGYKSFTKYVFCKHMIPICGLSFCSRIRVIHTEVFHFNKAYLFFVSIHHAFSALLKTPLNRRSSRFILFFSVSLIVLHFTFRLMICYQLIFISTAISMSKSFFSFWHIDLQIF